MAVQRGARAVISERPIAGIPNGIINLVCNDGPALLADYARQKIKTKSCHVIGVSGCIGKSSTTHTIWRMLNSLNSGSAILFDRTRTTYIGLAIDVCRALRDEQYLVVELQSDSTGQIPALCSVSLPDTAIVTRITHAHLSKLHTIAAIIQEETSPLEYSNLAILNADDSYLCSLGASLAQPLVYFGEDRSAEVRIEKYNQGRFGVEFSITARGVSHKVVRPGFGKQSASAAAASAAFAITLGVPVAEVASALSSIDAPPGRMEAFQRPDGGILILDAYNAGLESTINALDALAMHSPPSWAIIGSMLELGPRTRDDHQALAEQLPQLDGLITVGEAARIVWNISHKNGRYGTNIHFESVERLIIALKDMSFLRGANVLIKGSGALRLERLAPFFLAPMVGNWYMKMNTSAWFKIASGAIALIVAVGAFEIKFIEINLQSVVAFIGLPLSILLFLFTLALLSAYFFWPKDILF
jgi:UDP-N-acetylmuramoyl-tripeptide--D-alanyl-D-alanine ligase